VKITIHIDGDEKHKEELEYTLATVKDVRTERVEGFFNDVDFIVDDPDDSISIGVDIGRKINELRSR